MRLRLLSVICEWLMAIVFATYFVSFAHEFRHYTIQLRLLRIDSLESDGQRLNDENAVDV